MTKWNRVLTLCFGILAMLSVGGLSVQEAAANPITYTQTGHLTGTIGSTAFTDAAVTLTTVGDTANVTDTSNSVVISLQNIGLTTIDIAGVGIATFSGDDFGMFSLDFSSLVPGLIVAGIGDLTITSGILGAVTTTYYDGVSNFNQTGTALSGTNTTFATTSMGDLFITGFSGDGTFTAVTSATVPEPSSLALMGLGGLGMAVRAIRRRRTSVVA